jgi:hypothetical protein
VCGEPAATKETACGFLEDPPPRGKKLQVITEAALTGKKPKAKPKPRPKPQPRKRKPGEPLTADELVAEALRKLR